MDNEAETECLQTFNLLITLSFDSAAVLEQTINFKVSTLKADETHLTHFTVALRHTSWHIVNQDVLAWEWVRSGNPSPLQPQCSQETPQPYPGWKRH